MTQTQTQVARDEDLLPEEREWLFGSDGNKETADRKAFQALNIINIVRRTLIGITLLVGFYGGQVFEPSSNNQTEVPVQTK